MTYLPNDELVAVAWVKTLGVVSVAGVATTLPKPDSWPDNQFVVATVLPGSPNHDVPVDHPVVSFECYANRPGSARPPWGQAVQLAKQLELATYRTLTRSTALLTMPTGYYPARLLSAYPVSGARRVPDDPSHFAHYTIDIQLNWAVEMAVAV